MKEINLYTDGSCLNNPGPGGYGVILKYKEHVKELSCGYLQTTNNRMEIMAVIVGLEQLKEPWLRNRYQWQSICQKRNYVLDQNLETKRLDDEQQKARQEQGFMAKTWFTLPKTPCKVGVGKGSRRTRWEWALRWTCPCRGQRRRKTGRYRFFLFLGRK